MIQSGTYRHYKGNTYQILGVAKHSETEETLVVYKALYGECGLWVRPLDMFCEKVEVDRKMVPRFELIQEGPGDSNEPSQQQAHGRKNQ
jgi:hypothetical protein